MEKELLIKKTLKNMTLLPEWRVKEVSDYVDLLLKKNDKEDLIEVVQSDSENKLYSFLDKVGEIPLKNPITVEITKGDDYIASIDSLHLFAYGENLDEVLNELKEDLSDLYNDLYSGKYTLAKPALDLKNEFNKLME